MPGPAAALGLLLAGGAAASAVGGAVSANAANQGNRASRDFRHRYVDQSRIGLANRFYGTGPGGGLDYLWGSMYDPDSDEESRRDPALGARAEAHAARHPTYLDRMSGLLDQHQGLTDRLQERGSRITANVNQAWGGLMSRYDAGTAGIDARLAGMEDEARRYAGDRSAAIERDRARAEKAGHQQSRASLAGLGYNTLGANQEAAISQMTRESADDAQTNLMMSLIDRMMTAKNARAQAMLAREGQRGQLAGLRVGNLQQNLQSNLAARYARAGEHLNLAMRPAEAELAMLSGQTMNPYLNYTPPAAVNSALGVGLQGIGNVATTLGGYGLAQGGYWGGQSNPNAAAPAPAPLADFTSGII